MKIRRITIEIGLAILITLTLASCTQSAPKTSPSNDGGIQIEFPEGSPGVFNVRDYGAKGDGVTDDTAAIRAAFKAIEDLPFSRPNADYATVFLPNGTYLVSDEIFFRQFRMMQGQSESGTIIRLKDNAPGFDAGKNKAVIRCIYSNNESIGNYIRNLTVDIGNGNPNAVGIRYNAHNQGMLEHVTIRSSDRSGAVGLDMAETEFGPALVKNVTIEGFDVGIFTPGTPSHATFAHIKLKRQNKLGIDNNLPVSIQDLQSENSVPAIRNSDANMNHLVLIGARLDGGSSGGSAIENLGTAYITGVTTTGYGSALKNKGAVIAGSSITDFSEGEKQSLFPSRSTHLGLGLTTAPEIFYESASKWAIPDASAEDDTPAIQRAIDSGASTIFLPWNTFYKITDTVIIRGNVRRIVGMKRSEIGGNFATFKNKPMLRLEGNGANPVSLEFFATNTYPQTNHFSLEVSTNQDVYLKSFQASPAGIVRTTTLSSGRIFMDDYLDNVRIEGNQFVQIRHYNTENNPYDPNNPRPTQTYAINDGGRLVVLGWKTEAPSINALTKNGGKTEVLGGFFRDFFDIPGIPYFETIDSSLTASYFAYSSGCGDARALQAKERRNAQDQELRSNTCSHAIALLSSAP